MADAPLTRPFPWEAHYPPGLEWPLDETPRPLFSLLDAACAAYCQTVMAMPQMKEWIKGAVEEPEELEELDVEF